MQGQEYFLKLLNRTSTSKLVQNDIKNSGKFISPQFHQALTVHLKHKQDYKDHSLNKDSSERSLGPGRYNTPQPPKVQSYRFSQTPRFLNEKYTLYLNKSYEKMNTIKTLPEIQKNSQSFREKLKKSKMETEVSKRAKEILLNDKTEKLKRVLRIKYEKAEYKKFAVVKDAICKSLSVLVVFIYIPFGIKFGAEKRICYLNKIHKSLRYFITISRAVGKFILNKKRAKVKKAWLSLKKIMPFHVRVWKRRRVKKFKLLISRAFDNFLETCSIKFMYQALVRYCTFLQKRVRRFLGILKARRICLLKFWKKLNKNKVPVPEEVKLEFINKYLSSKLNEHYYLLNKEKKLLYLLSENRHEDYIYEISHNKKHLKPVLRIFVRKDFLDLIKFAYDMQKNWNSYRKIQEESRSSPLGKKAPVTFEKSAKKKVTFKNISKLANKRGSVTAPPEKLHRKV